MYGYFVDWPPYRQDGIPSSSFGSAMGGMRSLYDWKTERRLLGPALPWPWRTALVSLPLAADHFASGSSDWGALSPHEVSRLAVLTGVSLDRLSIGSGWQYRNAPGPMCFRLLLVSVTDGLLVKSS